jgi:hypothetical protein
MGSIAMGGLQRYSGSSRKAGRPDGGSYGPTLAVEDCRKMWQSDESEDSDHESDRQV